MRVIIIAAGYASRLGDITKTTPKGLLDINGKTILERQISLFKKNQINEIIIITGPHKNFGIENILYLNDDNYAEHDVLGSLMAAKDKIEGKILTSYSDILFEESILKEILSFSGDIGIPIDLNWEKSYEGRTQHPKSEADNVLIRNDKIIKIKKNIEKTNDEDVIGEFLGPMILSEKGSKLFVDTFMKIQKNHVGKFHNAPSFKKAYLTDMLQELIDLNIDVKPIFIEGNWCEIDTPQDLEKARKLFS
ncbi:NTP transferase domain-containing protein [Nitrosopumilus sp.]|uniref:phosphocholine cytidylyltransferase family protein n=1 Tax=Nitrosopumilus sp. TaxID=2024843 RepID=UPI00247B9F23|nr:NTP transferase domain-containing protein [Nitrosopumilus sp.]MCV0430392.1 NTP transferase domain-containing protein [Nitrosopumilus sp.]